MIDATPGWECDNCGGPVRVTKWQPVAILDTNTFFSGMDQGATEPSEAFCITGCWPLSGMGPVDRRGVRRIA